MPILRDFECPKCAHQFEEFDVSDQEFEEIQRRCEYYEPVCCPKCNVCANKIFKGHSAAVLEQIIPIYPGSKKHKAGYMHTKHADQKATKYQIGYGGFQGSLTE